MPSPGNPFSNTEPTLLTSPPMTTNAVHLPTLKLPVFWPHDVELWFYQVEALFAAKRVNTEVARYNYLVASISPEVAANVRRYIINRPAKEPYSALKNTLLERYQLSPAKQLQSLTNELLGDRTPSQLLDRLEQLGLSGMSEGMQTQMFVSKLPEAVRTSLVGLDLGIVDLARRADRILEQVDQAPLPPVFAVSQPPRQARHPSASGQGNTGTGADGRTLCYYHWRFGKDATKCQSGCSMAAGN